MASSCCECIFQVVCTAASAQEQWQGLHSQAIAEAVTREEQWAGRKPELVRRCWNILGLEEALGRASLVNEHNWHVVLMTDMPRAFALQGVVLQAVSVKILCTHGIKHLYQRCWILWCPEMCWGKTFLALMVFKHADLEWIIPWTGQQLINWFAMKGKGNTHFLPPGLFRPNLVRKKNIYSFRCKKACRCSQVLTAMCQWESRSGREPGMMREALFERKTP